MGRSAEGELLLSLFVARLKPNNFVELAARFFVFAQHHQRHAQIISGRDVSRMLGDNGAKVSAGAVEVSFKALN